MTNRFGELEEKVMDLLLRGDDPVLALLRQQLGASTVASRQFTGAGFFTNYQTPTNAKPVGGGKSFKFGDVEAEVDGLKNGAGFVLHVEGGLLHMLEGYSYDEPWPENITDFRVSYVGARRDLAFLRKKWSG